MRDVDPKVDEAIETLNMKDGPTRRRLLSGHRPGQRDGGGLRLARGVQLERQQRHFVDHRFGREQDRELPEDSGRGSSGSSTTSPRTCSSCPPSSGCKDAAALLGLPTPKWGGSTTSAISDMVNYMKTAIAAKASGIATTVINATPTDTTFDGPVAQRHERRHPRGQLQRRRAHPQRRARHPAPTGSATSARRSTCPASRWAQRIKSLAKSKGEVVIFIATPGTANIQPRYDGAASVLTPAGFTVHMLATGASTPAGGPGREGVPDRRQVQARGRVRGGRGLDRAARPALASVGLAGKIPAGGFDLTPGTLTAIKAGQLDFTINQDPYLQGFLPVLYLYLYNLTGGLVLPPDTDTGLTFVTKSQRRRRTSRPAPRTRARPAPPSRPWCRGPARSRTRSPPPAPDASRGRNPDSGMAAPASDTGPVSAGRLPGVGAPRERRTASTREGEEREVSETAAAHPAPWPDGRRARPAPGTARGGTCGGSDCSCRGSARRPSSWSWSC